MDEPRVNRKLAAILSADVVGYSKLMANDEAATVDTIKQYRVAIGHVIERHKGRIVNAPGDNILAEFASAVEAVQAAVEIQRSIEGRNVELPEERRMHFRIGLNLGDVIEEDDGTIYGDGVNIAARMEALADEGGICISSTIHDAVEGKLDFGFDFLGERPVKNIEKPVRVYRVRGDLSENPEIPTGNKKNKVPLMMAAAALVVAFVGVSAWQFGRGPASQESGAASNGDSVVVLPGDLSIAVLPFRNMSGHPEQEYFSDGLTEDIMGAIAQFSEVTVIARNSTFRYKGQAVDVRVVGEELGVEYLVEGSVQRMADTIRVAAQLIETKTGSHLWDETFDETLTAANIFAIQDDIAASVATTLAGYYGVLSQDGIKSARRKAPGKLSSYDCVLLSMEYWRTLSPDAYELPRNCLEKAVENDPGYGRAWAELSHMYVEAYMMDYKSGPENVLELSLKAAQRAVEVAPTDIRGRWALANSRFMRGELDAFIAAADSVIEARSKDYAALGELGLWFCYSGDWDKGLALIEEAKAYDPHYPKWIDYGYFFDLYRNGDYEAALKIAHAADLPDYVWGQALFAAAYGQLGRAAQAQPYVKRILELDPDFETTARANRWKWFRHQEGLLNHFMDGLRKAGLDIPGDSKSSGQTS